MSSSDPDSPPLLTTSAIPDPPETLHLENPQETPPRIPLTIVTGYLGAGKTTLLNHLLSTHHNKRIAIILNEFGDSGDIEKALTMNHAGQEVTEWLEVANGCICCSVRDAGVAAIEGLVERQRERAQAGKGEGVMDYILLETSGLADAGSLARMFWVDEGLGSSIYLDGIVVVVDGVNLARSLAEEGDGGVTTAHLQIGCADVVVINKVDGLASEQEVESVVTMVRGINGLARIEKTSFGRVEKLEGTLLDLRAYDDVDLEGLDAKGIGRREHLDETISTVAVQLPILSPKKLERLDTWLQKVLWERELPSSSVTQQADFDIHRLKGLLVVEGENGREIKMVQGVRETYDITDLKREGEDVGQGKLVLIGRHVQSVDWERSLKAWMEI